MASGPTQNYDDATLGTWRPRPVLAMTLRALIIGVPMLLALGVGLVAVHWFPPARLGLNPWLWLVLQMTVSITVVLLVGRWTRRLLPLATLLRMTLVFPDRAPSRFAVARRTYSPAMLERRISEPRPSGGTDEADLVLELVSALGAHDRVTFRHSERVQAYAALIAAEMGLAREDAVKLSWAALLHDVGKLRVPQRVLASSRRPTESEWSVLTTHPEAGMDIASPLTAWLGPFVAAIGQHHERWDGGGYPAGLAGTEIVLAARIVAVADAFDVITSARPYKEPLTAAAAREELARCAGSQFDPDVVHAFLRVGLGKLRAAAGPLSVLTALPGFRVLPASDLSSAAAVLTSSGQAAGTAMASAAVGATLAASGALGPVALPVHQEVAAVVEPGPGNGESMTRDAAPAAAPGTPGTDAVPSSGSSTRQPPDRVAGAPEAPGADAPGRGTAGAPATPDAPGADAPGRGTAGVPATPATGTNPSTDRTEHAGAPGLPTTGPADVPTTRPETPGAPTTTTPGLDQRTPPATTVTTPAAPAGPTAPPATTTTTEPVTPARPEPATGTRPDRDATTAK